MPGREDGKDGRENDAGSGSVWRIVASPNPVGGGRGRESLMSAAHFERSGVGGTVVVGVVDEGRTVVVGRGSGGGAAARENSGFVAVCLEGDGEVEKAEDEEEMASSDSLLRKATERCGEPSESRHADAVAGWAEAAARLLLP